MILRVWCLIEKWLLHFRQCTNINLHSAKYSIPKRTKVMFIPIRNETASMEARKLLLFHKKCNTCQFFDTNSRVRLLSQLIPPPLSPSFSRTHAHKIPQNPTDRNIPTPCGDSLGNDVDSIVTTNGSHLSSRQQEEKSQDHARARALSLRNTDPSTTTSSYISRITTGG